MSTSRPNSLRDFNQRQPDPAQLNIPAQVDRATLQGASTMVSVAAAGGTIGLTVGSLFGPVGSLIGFSTGAVAGGIGGLVAGRFVGREFDRQATSKRIAEAKNNTLKKQDEEKIFQKVDGELAKLDVMIPLYVKQNIPSQINRANKFLREEVVGKLQEITKDKLLTPLQTKILEASLLLQVFDVTGQEDKKNLMEAALKIYIETYKSELRETMNKATKAQPTTDVSFDFNQRTADRETDPLKQLAVNYQSKTLSWIKDHYTGQKPEKLSMTSKEEKKLKELEDTIELLTVGLQVKESVYQDMISKEGKSATSLELAASIEEQREELDTLITDHTALLTQIHQRIDPPHMTSNASVFFKDKGKEKENSPKEAEDKNNRPQKPFSGPSTSK